jgi:hypothetical protein
MISIFMDIINYIERIIMYNAWEYFVLSMILYIWLYKKGKGNKMKIDYERAAVYILMFMFCIIIWALIIKWLL